MAYFDFHNLLSPFDFEILIRDILEIRESPLKFKTYKIGKDGGIDIRSTTADEEIIVQVKLYNPKNFTQLKSSLIQEVVKVKTIQPKRYILAIGHSLSPMECKTLMEIFDGFIQNEEDILDRETLNKYLGQKAYQSVLNNHTKLLVPNISILEHLLSYIINKDVYTRTIRELKDSKQNQKLYHNTNAGNDALKQLKKK